MLGEIARGGMGIVLRVRDGDLRRKLAMKVVRDEGAAADARTIGRFLEEAQITSQLDHPGIVPVHEIGVGDDGRPFMTMRLVRGDTLRDVFERAAAGDPEWTHARVVGVLQKVCEAMAYAHDKKVIHRDLKPANIMVGRFGEVYVMDWGLARLLDREDPHDLRFAGDDGSASAITTERDAGDDGTPESPLMTCDGQVLGTPAYMSPEQAMGQLDRIGPPADVYAVGAMLYHLIAGQMPYVPAGAKPTGKAVRWRVVEGPPQPLAGFGRRAPQALVAICEKAMAREPGHRYPNMRALERDLRAFVEGGVVAAYETGTWAETRKWLRRNKWLAAALFGAVVAVALCIAALAAWSISEDRANKDERVLAARAALERLRVIGNDFEGRAHGTSGRPAAVEWLELARQLVDMLPVFETELAGIRALAQPSAEGMRVASAAFDRAYELSVKKKELKWRDRVLGLVEWLPAEQVDEAVARCNPPEDPLELNGYVFERVRPDDLPRIYGQEQVALRLAERLVAKFDTSTAASVLGTRDSGSRRASAWHPRFRDTHAFALWRVGKFDEAVAKQLEAVSEPLPKDGMESAWRKDLRNNLRLLERERNDLRSGRWRATRDDLAAEVADMDQEVRDLAVRIDASEHSPRIELYRQVVRGLRALRGRLLSAEAAYKHPRWQQAIAAIRTHAAYRGLAVAPQLDLVPLGPDPTSGLWEFVHLPTGTEPERGADGRLELKADTGLVFVLLPAGCVPVVAGRRRDERHDREVDAFFLSKFEMTRSQWIILAGRWPGPTWVCRDLSPVVAGGFSISDALNAMAGAGGWLRVPLGVEWEYGCRARTTTPLWPGTDVEQVAASGNFSDTRAPIGRFRANAFGLHDTIGNVAEWCLIPARPFDRSALVGVSPLGGCFGRPPLGQECDAERAKSLVQGSSLVDGSPMYGLRPARSLHR
ncbi:MAG: protein kinase [Planctomycetes bacterium]|nr:protein kinase [Planctomycetota bacterium]MCB9888964.1 protein kinase [Planctomycetota bacterium]